MAQIERRLAAIMLTDIVGYTAKAQRNEILALDLLEEHFSLVRDVFPAFGGTEVKTLGDGFLLQFPSAVDACRCAIEIQRRIRERNLELLENRRFEIRIGLHIGDVVFRDQDAFGDGINVASRIEPLARPGGICISDDLARQVRNKLDAPLEPLGSAALKNIQDRMEVYSIVLPWETPRKPASRAITSRRSFLPAVAAAAVILAAVPAWFALGRFPLKKQAGNSRGNLAALAVLPFQVSGPDDSSDYLGDGISEELINALNRVAGVRVVARTSAFSFKGKNVDVREIGRVLGVGSILEGSVQKEGARLRVTARLVNATDGFQLWAESFDGSVKDVFSFQDSIAHKIAAKLDHQVAPGEGIVKAYTSNPEAYTLVLKGRALADSPDRLSVENGIRHFQRALSLEPDLAEAYAGLADAYFALSTAHLPPNDVMPKSRNAALKAIALDDSLAAAHTSLGQCYMMYDFDFAKAKEEFDRAVALDPNHARARLLRGFLPSLIGEYERGIADMKLAMRLDPLARWYRAFRTMAQINARRFSEMVEENSPAKLLALLQLGRFDEARAIRDKMEMRQTASSSPPVFDSAYFYAKTGKKEQALKIIEDLKKRSIPDHQSIGFVRVYGALGMRDEAFRWLDRVVAARQEELSGILVQPGFDPLREDPRFLVVLRKLGLSKYAHIGYKGPLAAAESR